MPVTIDEASLDKFTEYARLGDNVGKELLVSSGNAFRVPNGTRVQFLGRAGFGAARARIIDGAHSGEEIYTYTEWNQKPVKRKNPHAVALGR